MCRRCVSWSSIRSRSLSLSQSEEAYVRCSSDPGSVNGDEVDRSAFSFSPCLVQPPQDLVSPTAGMLGGVPRCLSPAHSEPFPSGSSLLSNGSHISGSISSLDSDASMDSHVPLRGRNKPEKRRERQDREAVLSPERRWASWTQTACPCPCVCVYTVYTNTHTPLWKKLRHHYF